ncbi:MAG: hypothetical protein ABIP68_05945 [Ferruginibacter sp.]
MKECLQCKKKYKAIRATSKFCSTNCRVKYSRGEGRKNKKKKIEDIFDFHKQKVELEVLRNSILNLAEQVQKRFDVDINYVQPEKESQPRNVEVRTSYTPQAIKKEEYDNGITAPEDYESELWACSDIYEIRGVLGRIKKDSSLPKGEQIRLPMVAQQVINEKGIFTD